MVFSIVSHFVQLLLSNLDLIQMSGNGDDMLGKGLELGELNLEQLSLIERLIGMVKRGEINSSTMGPSGEQTVENVGRTTFNNPIQVNNGGEPVQVGVLDSDLRAARLGGEFQNGIRDGVHAEGTVDPVSHFQQRAAPSIDPSVFARSIDDDRRSQGSSRGFQNRATKIKVDSMKIPRFNGSDFNMWRIQMELFMEAAGVWDLVNGTLVGPCV